MATTPLKLWREGPEIDQCGLIIAGITVSWAELELAEDRTEALEMGSTPDLCDEYEAQGGSYQLAPSAIGSRCKLPTTSFFARSAARGSSTLARMPTPPA